MFTPTPFLIALIVGLYIIHRSFHKVDTLGFVTSGVIGLTINFYLVKYLNVSQLAAMFITLVIFPVLEILWALAKRGFTKEAEIHHWHMPHMPHPDFLPQSNQQSATKNTKTRNLQLSRRAHGISKHPPI